MPLAGSQYLISGAASDIGAALVARLRAVPDSRCLMTTRRTALEPPGPIAPPHRLVDGVDLASEVGLARLGKEVATFFTAPFTFIHSVGDFWYHKSIEDTALPEAEQMMRSHYGTLYGAIRAVLPVMIKLGGGRILAFSCTSVDHSYPEMAAFTSAKAAVQTLIKCVANEYARHGVVANAIALSTIRTAKVEASKASEYHEGYVWPNELVETVMAALDLPPIINGNVLRLLKYSESFYNEGYFRRNRKLRP
jgi:NAD(P)-dependent dehydrogenase (short-subunit alcohol dehydrogenase family)